VAGKASGGGIGAQRGLRASREDSRRRGQREEPREKERGNVRGDNQPIRAFGSLWGATDPNISAQRMWLI